MRKKLFSLVLVALILVTSCLFTGFHGRQGLDKFEVPEEWDADREYEITFWAKNDTNKSQVEIYQKAITDFEALYPNIHVTLKLYTDYSRIYNDVITNIATGTTPNVCITYPDHIATYLTGDNSVVQLEELMNDARYGLGGSEIRFDAPTTDEIIPEFLEECRVNGEVSALPFMRSTEALYINKDFVEALGYEIPDVPTWDWIWEVSEAATAKNEDGTYALNGQEVMIPFIYKSTDNMMIQSLKQLGADYSTEDGEIGLFNDSTRAVLKTVAEHVETGAFSTFKISSYPANFLNAGQCVFAIDSTAGATWMGTDAPNCDIAEENLVEFETVVRPIPQYDTENPAMISQGPSVCLFNKSDRDEVLASWFFVQYLLTDDVQIAYSQTEGYVPVTSKARENAAYTEYLAREGEDDPLYYSVKREASKLLLENTEHTFTTPVFPGSASLREAAGSLIEETAKSVRRKQTVDEAYYENLFSSTESLYRLDSLSGNSENGIRDLGPLSTGAKALIIGLACAWVGIAAAFFLPKLKKKK